MDQREVLHCLYPQPLLLRPTSLRVIQFTVLGDCRQVEDDCDVISTVQNDLQSWDFMVQRVLWDSYI